MVSEAPPFWWIENAWQAHALAPLAWVYGRVARWRMEKAARTRVDVPVICVGNFTVGGAGKTPAALALGGRLIERGMTPGFLSRGYGGSLEGTFTVDPAHHRARDVGDEPLLLAARARTVISPDRVAGAKRLIEEGADIIVMDDGFQSARLNFDYALLVVDAGRGLGNRRIIPAGPVRAPVVDQLRHASGLLKVGEGTASDWVIRLAGRAAKPIFRARIEPERSTELEGVALLAFAGIGDPQKFFRTLEEMGCDLRERRTFPDHHDFSETDANALLSAAERDGLALVTTSKDMIRLAGQAGEPGELARRAHVLAVKLTFVETTACDRIIDDALASFRRRKPAR